MFMRTLDIVTSVTLILGVYLCGTKPKIGWLIYTINSVLYSLLMFLNNLNCMGVVGLILVIIGIKNYIKVKRGQTKR